METFCALTKPYAKMYKYRTAEVKDCDQHVSYQVRLIKGECLDPIREATRVLDDPHKVQKMFHVAGDLADELPQLSFEFVIQLSAEYAIREMPRMYDHSAHGVRALREDEDTMDVAEDFARDWWVINHAEEVALAKHVEDEVRRLHKQSWH